MDNELLKMYADMLEHQDKMIQRELERMEYEASIMTVTLWFVVGTSLVIIAAILVATL